MQLLVLDKFIEGEATCLLCKTSLAEYVEALPSDFRDYYIQRGIVTNRFLDNLWDTLSNMRHIPPIVLVGETELPDVAVGNSFSLGNNFKVLDGLQRSHRLKEIWDTIVFIDQNVSTYGDGSAARIARNNVSALREKSISPQIFQKVFETIKNDEVEGKALFSNNNIWLEIWFDLSEPQQIRKMLILNAGHKSVNIKHQIELLFYNNLENLQAALKPASIVREKDKSSTSYSKARQAGEFHFAHVISAFVSLMAGETVTTNADFTAAQSFKGESATDESLLDIDDRQLVAFAQTLSLLDKGFRTEEGIRWLGREVVLVGVFGAIGAFAKETSQTMVETLQFFNVLLPDFESAVDLEAFEKWRNSLELSKVNIGSINRRAVYRATLNFLKGRTTGSVDWQKLTGEFDNDAS
jgi:hypothetical protein